MSGFHDLSCVVHLHSTHSDGTGTVAEIARAGEEAGVDVVLLTDHDTMAARRRGEEGWYGSTLLLAGHEVSPAGRNHYLAFGVDEKIDHRGLSPAEIVEAVHRRGGFGFAAHPFSTGSERFKRVRSLGTSMEWEDLESLDGLELWSFVADNGQNLPSVRDAVRFIARPERYVTGPPEGNLVQWDRLGARRRVVGIGGLDAHQFGRRFAGRVVRVMSYRRTFRQLHTNVLCTEAPTGELDHDRDQVFEALRAGRCYVAVPHLAPAKGFRFFGQRAGGERIDMGAEAAAGAVDLRAELPSAADVRLLRDGRELTRMHAPAIAHRVEEPGVYRVEARLEAHGAERAWILSNPIYLR